MMMKILIVAVICTMFPVAYCEASGATESNQLIDKMMAELKLEPQKALVYFVQVEEYGQLYKGGGALLGRTWAITTFANLIEFIDNEVDLSKLHVGIGAHRINQETVENDHSVENIIQERSTAWSAYSRLVLVLLKNLSKNPEEQRLSVQYMPIATRSYTPGDHTVSEFFIGWNKNEENSKIPVRFVSVDTTGIITFEMFIRGPDINSHKLFNYHGGFLTRRKTLAGIIFRLITRPSNDGPVKIGVLPISGNTDLFENLNNGEIMIKNIDSTEDCGSTTGS